VTYVEERPLLDRDRREHGSGVVRLALLGWPWLLCDRVGRRVDVGHGDRTAAASGFTFAMRHLT
jgi:hypothetical protein